MLPSSKKGGQKVLVWKTAHEASMREFNTYIITLYLNYELLIFAMDPFSITHGSNEHHHHVDSMWREMDVTE